VASTTGRVGVIGGGIAGLTAAYRLARAGYRVTLWERGRFGGQAATMPVAGTRLEIFYHHLFQSDRDIVAIAEELGVGDMLIWRPSNVGYFADGRIYPLNGAVDLLRLGFLPIHDRIRLGIVTAYLQRVRNWQKFETITAHHWLQRALGKRAYDRTFGAQLRAKFGRYYDQVAMVWFWGKIWLRTTSRRSPLDQEQLGYFRGSFQTIVDALYRGCEEAGVELRRVGLTSLHQDDGDRWRVQAEDGSSDVFDAVVATVPSNVFRHLVPNLPEQYAAKLGKLVYEAAVVVLLQLKRPLTDIYWLNIADPDLPFTAVIEHTNFISAEEYDGKHFVYLSKYMEPDHSYFSLDDESLIAEYLPFLTRLNGAFEEEWVEQSWVFRERAAQPIIPLNYSDNIPDHRTPLPNLYLANTTQIYPEDRGTNYSVRLGNTIAAMVAEDIRRVDH
jgi:protoporphyrinogen oxidase